MATWRHLARRFVATLRARALAADEQAWVGAVLTDAEQALFDALSRPDQRHALVVARHVAATRPDDQIARRAALLHDIGKLDAALSTMGRVIATVADKLTGHTMAEAWSATRGFTRRVGLYLRHDEIGADRLRLAGSPELVVCWAREHHRPPSAWTIDATLGELLKAADDD